MERCAPISLTNKAFLLDPLRSLSMISLSLDDVRRVVDDEDIIDRVVFDLDDLIAQERSVDQRSGNFLSNSDELL